ncbi:PilN domain-containing protein [Endozoicomonas sp. G2_2]|uniref:PilN domain-containing protein n=1 Tax=Endozoicomonas sp. G2_2 TaxID=2821092 RepID=UPI001ADD42AF|nr:PilN domain-containing protein [Endozoicomonas sp. G2_2]MBO9469698.1 PilN domain-containing protein [Endozoicomonas sp. G2_2]
MSTLIRINLLDWRAAARERKRKRFLTLLVLAALASVVVVGVIPMLYYNHLIDVQESRNRYLESQIAIADRQLVEIRALQKTRESLITRMRIIEELQQSRSGIVHYFDQLVDTLPNGVYLSSLVQKGNTTTLDGVAESNARVSDYMVNLDDAAWFADPRLIVIKSSENGPQRFADFTLTVKGDSPNAKPADDQSGPANNPTAPRS